MSDLSWAEISRRVHERAGFRCEYCQTPQRVIGQAMHVEHIIPGGGDDLLNLCLSCPNCNLSKALATTARDPGTELLVPLFNPRTERWLDHFAWGEDGRIIQGLTPTGRATVARLRMNRQLIVEARAIWITAGVYPPEDVAYSSPSS